MILQCTRIVYEVLIFRYSNGFGPCISKFVTWVGLREMSRKEASEPKADEVPTEKEHRFFQIFEGQVAPKSFCFFYLITPFWGPETFVNPPFAW